MWIFLLFTAKISNALCWPISRDIKSFVNLFTRDVKPCIIRKNVPARIYAQLQECVVRLVTVTSQPASRTSTASFAVSQAKCFFLFNQMKRSTVTDLVENFKPERLCCKVLVSKRLATGNLKVLSCCLNDSSLPWDSLLFFCSCILAFGHVVSMRLFYYVSRWFLTYCSCNWRNVFATFAETDFLKGGLNHTMFRFSVFGFSDLLLVYFKSAL